MRGLLRFDRFLTLACSIVLVACDVGSVPLAGPGGDGPDGGAGGAPSPDPSAGGVADGAPVDIACVDPVATGESGEHNAGEPCLDCHANGEGPSFELAGTVFSSLAGGTPVVGATIQVTDANGTVHTAISARNGNFWLREAIALPVQVQASSCPSAQPMITPSAVGNCNAAGCHDADFRIHLP